MLLRNNIQVPFTNSGTTTINAGDPVIVGDRQKYNAVFGVTPAQVQPGEKGVIDLVGEFSFQTTDIPVVSQFQQIYANNSTNSNKVSFILTANDKSVYAGIAAKARANTNEPLVILVGVNNTVYKAAAGASSSAPSGGEAGAMSDSSTVVEPSNSSGPGAM